MFNSVGGAAQSTLPSNLQQNSITHQPQIQNTQSNTNPMASMNSNSINHSSSSSSRPTNAFVKIIEQPASKALRFRYECEGRLPK